jgi:isoquinoline 1-oxidoreductase beta subunit
VIQSRREFLATAKNGLLLGIAGGSVVSFAADFYPDPGFSPSDYLSILPNGAVRVFVGQGEMGQDIFSGLAMLIAEELNTPLEEVEVVAAPVAAAFGNSFFPGSPQMTAASSSMKVFYVPYRTAGATAREMLRKAASSLLAQQVNKVALKSGKVICDDRESIAFSRVLPILVDTPVPTNVELKDPSEFKIIGTTQRSIDVEKKVSGKLGYGMDTKVPGALTAVVAHPPSFGATVKEIDASETLALSGVHEVLMIPTGVAVIGDNYWIADSGKKALKIHWDESAGQNLSTAAILETYKVLARKPGQAFTFNPIPGMDYQLKPSLGPEKYAQKNGGSILESEFMAPYLAHAPMEPLNCTIFQKDGKVHVHTGTHYQFADKDAVVKTLGVTAADVRLHTLPMGGSFGRRACPKSDWIVEAAQIFKLSASAKTNPIKLVWSREDDITGGWYRPLVFSKISAALREDGRIGSWAQRIVGQPAIDHDTLSFVGPESIDLTTVDAVGNLVYDVEDRVVDVHHTENIVPVQWMRSVGHSHNVFFVETFMSELADLAGVDQLDFRLNHITEDRVRRVLELVAEKGHWYGGISKDGKGQGLSVHEFYGTYVANLAEVVRVAEDKFKISKIVYAVDLGTAVNPDAVKAQMESGAVLALSSAIYGEIELQKGAPQQSNFDTYKSLRFSQCPEIETHLVSSTSPPTGAGETGVPSVAPAVCNAIAKLRGKYLRDLPISKHGVKIV